MLRFEINTFYFFSVRILLINPSEKKPVLALMKSYLSYIFKLPNYFESFCLVETHK